MKRRRLNPGGYQRAMQMARTFKELRMLVDLYHGMVLAMNRDGDMRLLRRMAEARERMQRYLDGMCPPIPELIPVSELEVVDIRVETGTRYCNFAIMHNGRILKDGFQTQPVAWQYVRDNITEPGEIAVRARRSHEVIELPGTPLHRSWSIH
jgi:hypothetical protein